VTTYATRRDVFRYGLPRGTLAGEGRLVESSSASTNVLTLESHGFETDDEVLVRAIEGGTLSVPLVAGTAYYVIRLTDSTFSLAAAAGGAAIDLTTTGVSMWVTIALPFAEILALYSRWVDDVVPHLVPFTVPYPVQVVAAVATLAGKRLQQIAGVSSISMAELEVGEKAQLERWGKGIPMRDTTATASSNLTITATLGASADARGWAPNGSDTL